MAVGPRLKGPKINSVHMRLLITNLAQRLQSVAWLPHEEKEASPIVPSVLRPPLRSARPRHRVLPSCNHAQPTIVPQSAAPPTSSRPDQQTTANGLPLPASTFVLCRLATSPQQRRRRSGSSSRLASRTQKI
ncbi:hypothetical protein U9M48_035230 [Paspalum notatum var. saurae]|uniref:Uncharacterized protein n=1 Tax=Paspalum notatum var. saurae TaxID=547442 RepID=A0AAQ3X869_PASNO